MIAVAGVGRPAGQSAGMSLPMAREYAGAAGGHVQVVETPEAASRFELWLPAG
jgi:signal transduction histidine kinase